MNAHLLPASAGRPHRAPAGAGVSPMPEAAVARQRVIAGARSDEGCESGPRTCRVGASPVQVVLVAMVVFVAVSLAVLLLLLRFGAEGVLLDAAETSAVRVNMEGFSLSQGRTSKTLAALTSMSFILSRVAIDHAGVPGVAASERFREATYNVLQAVIEAQPDDVGHVGYYNAGTGELMAVASFEAGNATSLFRMRDQVFEARFRSPLSVPVLEASRVGAREFDGDSFATLPKLYVELVNSTMHTKGEVSLRAEFMMAELFSPPFAPEEPCAESLQSLKWPGSPIQLLGHPVVDQYNQRIGVIVLAVFSRTMVLDVSTAGSRRTTDGLSFESFLLVPTGDTFTTLSPTNLQQIDAIIPAVQAGQSSMLREACLRYDGRITNNRTVDTFGPNSFAELANLLFRVFVVTDTAQAVLDAVVNQKHGCCGVSEDVSTCRIPRNSGLDLIVIVSSAIATGTAEQRVVTVATPNNVLAPLSGIRNVAVSTAVLIATGAAVAALLAFRRIQLMKSTLRREADRAEERAARAQTLTRELQNMESERSRSVGTTSHVLNSQIDLVWPTVQRVTQHIGAGKMTAALEEAENAQDQLGVIRRHVGAMIDFATFLAKPFPVTRDVSELGATIWSVARNALQTGTPKHLSLDTPPVVDFSVFVDAARLPGWVFTDKAILSKVLGHMLSNAFSAKSSTSVALHVFPDREHAIPRHLGAALVPAAQLPYHLRHCFALAWLADHLLARVQDRLRSQGRTGTLSFSNETRDDQSSSPHGHPSPNPDSESAGRAEESSDTSADEAPASGSQVSIAKEFERMVFTDAVQSDLVHDQRDFGRFAVKWTRSVHLPGTNREEFAVSIRFQSTEWGFFPSLSLQSLLRKVARDARVVDEVLHRFRREPGREHILRVLREHNVSISMGESLSGPASIVKPPAAPPQADARSQTFPVHPSEVIFAEEAESVVFAVKDTGLGINFDMVGTYFDMFSSSGHFRTQTRQGLGLPLLQGYTAALGGQLGMWSFLGDGTTFWVSIPIFPMDDPSISPIGPPSRQSTSTPPGLARRVALLHSRIQADSFKSQQWFTEFRYQKSLPQASPRILERGADATAHNGGLLYRDDAVSETSEASAHTVHPHSTTAAYPQALSGAPDLRPREHIRRGLRQSPPSRYAVSPLSPAPCQNSATAQSRIDILPPSPRPVRNARPSRAVVPSIALRESRWGMATRISTPSVLIVHDREGSAEAIRHLYTSAPFFAKVDVISSPAAFLEFLLSAPGRGTDPLGARVRAESDPSSEKSSMSTQLRAVLSSSSTTGRNDQGSSAPTLNMGAPHIGQRAHGVIPVEVRRQRTTVSAGADATAAVPGQQMPHPTLSKTTLPLTATSEATRLPLASDAGIGSDSGGSRQSPASGHVAFTRMGHSQTALSSEESDAGGTGPMTDQPGTTRGTNGTQVTSATATTSLTRGTGSALTPSTIQTSSGIRSATRGSAASGQLSDVVLGARPQKPLQALSAHREHAHSLPAQLGGPTKGTSEGARDEVGLSVVPDEPSGATDSASVSTAISQSGRQRAFLNGPRAHRKRAGIGHGDAARQRRGRAHPRMSSGTSDAQPSVQPEDDAEIVEGKPMHHTLFEYTFVLVSATMIGALRSVLPASALVQLANGSLPSLDVLRGRASSPRTLGPAADASVPLASAIAELSEGEEDERKSTSPPSVEKAEEDGHDRSQNVAHDLLASIAPRDAQHAHTGEDGDPSFVTQLRGSLVASAKDSQRFAVAGGHRFQVWDHTAHAAARLHSTVETDKAVSSLTWRRGGDMLAVAYEVGVIELYRVQQSQSRLVGTTAVVNASFAAWIEFSPSGRLLAALAGPDVIVWNTSAPGMEEFGPPFVLSPARFPGPVRACTWRSSRDILTTVHCSGPNRTSGASHEIEWDIRTKGDSAALNRVVGRRATPVSCKGATHIAWTDVDDALAVVGSSLPSPMSGSSGPTGVHHWLHVYKLVAPPLPAESSPPRSREEPRKKLAFALRAQVPLGGPPSSLFWHTLGSSLNVITTNGRVHHVVFPAQPSTPQKQLMGTDAHHHPRPGHRSVFRGPPEQGREPQEAWLYTREVQNRGHVFAAPSHWKQTMYIGCRSGSTGVYKFAVSSKDDRLRMAVQVNCRHALQVAKSSRSDARPRAQQSQDLQSSGAKPRSHKATGLDLRTAFAHQSVKRSPKRSPQRRARSKSMSKSTQNATDTVTSSQETPPQLVPKIGVGTALMHTAGFATVETPQVCRPAVLDGPRNTDPEHGNRSRATSSATRTTEGTTATTASSRVQASLNDGDVTEYRQRRSQSHAETRRSTSGTEAMAGKPGTSSSSRPSSGFHNGSQGSTVSDASSDVDLDATDEGGPPGGPRQLYNSNETGVDAVLQSTGTSLDGDVPFVEAMPLGAGPPDRVPTARAVTPTTTASAQGVVGLEKSAHSDEEHDGSGPLDPKLAHGSTGQLSGADSETHMSAAGNLIAPPAHPVLPPSASHARGVTRTTSLQQLDQEGEAGASSGHPKRSVSGAGGTRLELNASKDSFESWTAPVAGNNGTGPSVASETGSHSNVSTTVLAVGATSKTGIQLPSTQHGIAQHGLRHLRSMVGSDQAHPRPGPRNTTAPLLALPPPGRGIGPRGTSSVRLAPLDRAVFRTTEDRGNKEPAATERDDSEEGVRSVSQTLDATLFTTLLEVSRAAWLNSLPDARRREADVRTIRATVVVMTDPRSAASATASYVQALGAVHAVVQLPLTLRTAMLVSKLRSVLVEATSPQIEPQERNRATWSGTESGLLGVDTHPHAGHPATGSSESGMLAVEPSRMPPVSDPPVDLNVSWDRVARIWSGVVEREVRWNALATSILKLNEDGGIQAIAAALDDSHVGSTAVEIMRQYRKEISRDRSSRTSNAFAEVLRAAMPAFPKSLSKVLELHLDALRTSSAGSGQGAVLPLVRPVVTVQRSLSAPGGHAIEVGEGLNSPITVVSGLRSRLPSPSKVARPTRDIAKTPAAELLDQVLFAQSGYPFPLDWSVLGSLAASVRVLHALVVDDQEQNQRMMVKLLASLKLGAMKVIVTRAHTGEQAITLTKSHGRSFDIVFMDINMEPMDGHETTLHLRRLEKRASPHEAMRRARSSCPGEAEVLRPRASVDGPHSGSDTRPLSGKQQADSILSSKLFREWASVCRVPVIAVTADAPAEVMKSTRGASLDGYLGKPVGRLSIHALCLLAAAQSAGRSTGEG